MARKLSRLKPILRDSRLDRKATTISPLVIIGVRTDGQKILLTVRAMGSESTQA
jgi:hypothetical protein